MAKLQLITPEWPLPSGVHALISTRAGGASAGPYQSANMGEHVGDGPAEVATNREHLARQCGVQKWQWLQQVHGVEVLEVGEAPITAAIADGVTTCHKGIACAVLTADCLPVLMCASDGSQVAALHAGWRGLADGIITHGVASFRCEPKDISAYLGPAIGPRHFEVGQDVVDAFALWGIEPALRQQLFQPRPERAQKYLAHLYGLARWRLNKLGVEQVFGGEYCTYGEPERFYSYRRDGVTGRMASAIWLAD